MALSQLNWNTFLGTLKSIKVRSVRVHPLTVHIHWTTPTVLDQFVLDKDTMVFKEDSNPLGLLRDAVLAACHNITKTIQESQEAEIETLQTATFQPSEKIFLRSRAGEFFQVQHIAVDVEVTPAPWIDVPLSSFSIFDLGVGAGEIRDSHFNGRVTIIERKLGGTQDDSGVSGMPSKLEFVWNLRTKDNAGG